MRKSVFLHLPSEFEKDVHLLALIRREEQSRVLPQEVVSAFGAPNVKSDSLSSLES